MIKAGLRSALLSNLIFCQILLQELRFDQILVVGVCGFICGIFKFWLGALKTFDPGCRSFGRFVLGKFQKYSKTLQKIKNLMKTYNTGFSQVFHRYPDTYSETLDMRKHADVLKLPVEIYEDCGNLLSILLHILPI